MRQEYIELEIPETLQGYIRACEDCHALCCGVHAFSPRARGGAAWCAEAGPEAVAEARAQLDVLVATVEDRSRRFSSSLINHCTIDEDARVLLLELLAEMAGQLQYPPAKIPARRKKGRKRG